MDKIKQYRHLIEQVLTAHGQIKPVYGDVEVHTAFDSEGDHYQVVRSGWNQGRRVYGSLVHIDLKGSKI